MREAKASQIFLMTTNKIVSFEQQGPGSLMKESIIVWKCFSLQFFQDLILKPKSADWVTILFFLLGMTRFCSFFEGR